MFDQVNSDLYTDHERKHHKETRIFPPVNVLDAVSIKSVGDIRSHFLTHDQLKIRQKQTINLRIIFIIIFEMIVWIDLFHIYDWND